MDAIGTLNLLEAIRLAGLEKHTRYYQARRAMRSAMHLHCCVLLCTLLSITTPGRDHRRLDPR